MPADTLSALLTPGARVHLIGIGGVSMCALGEVLHDMGLIVSGCDAQESEATTRLRAKGVPVAIGHAGEHVARQDMVIRTAAAREDNPDVIAARAQGIPLFERAQAWGALMRTYPNAVCVSGTHGKTTTTSMTAQIALQAGLDPTVMIGGTLPLIGAGHRVGRGDLIIAEACEYCNSFLSFFPTIAVVLNVEADHLDFFRDLADVQASFARFAALAPVKNGHIVVNHDDPAARQAVADGPAPILTFGLTPGADVTAAALCWQEGRPSFDVMVHGTFYAHIDLAVPGSYNALNALAACASAYLLGVPGQRCTEALQSFHGAGRRFEYKGTYHGARVVDDYAHHPGEIKAALRAARALPHKRLICVFQPHTYTRTEKLFDGFIEALGQADLVLFSEIYAARETPTGISSQHLADALAGSRFCPTFEDSVRVLAALAQPGDLILTMGAGDVYRIGEMLLEPSKNCGFLTERV